MDDPPRAVGEMPGDKRPAEWLPRREAADFDDGGALCGHDRNRFVILHLQIADADFDVIEILQNQSLHLQKGIAALRDDGIRSEKHILRIEGVIGPQRLDIARLKRRRCLWPSALLAARPRFRLLRAQPDRRARQATW
ncbi:hypothetical protein [Paracoccus aminophilus]|nr:hypothetical protein [Paracoccus aminophilus]